MDIRRDRREPVVGGSLGHASVQPDIGPVEADIGARRVRVTDDPLVHHDRRLPPEQRDPVGLIDQIVLKLGRDRLALRRIEFAGLLLEQFIDFTIDGARAVLRIEIIG